MSRKRRQRSTAIRKRVEKRQREAAKAAKRKAKIARAAGELGGVMVMQVNRASADGAIAQITSLEERLASEGSIRGWSVDDLQEDWGLSWLNGVLGEAVDGPGGARLEIEFPEVAKDPLVDRLSVLDRAAPGLGIEWDSGLDLVSEALRESILLEEEEEEEDEDGDGDGDDSTTDSTDSTETIETETT